MNQNVTVDNDLQKAIDDITKNTSIDPVFSDPVAAPSSVPEGDTGELAEAVGPFPEPQLEVPVPPIPEATSMPENMVAPEPVMPPAPAVPVPPVPVMPEPIVATETTFATGNLNMHQVKEAALRDLAPLLEKLNMEPSQKFNIYRDMFENLRDYTVLEAAYRTAKNIPDDNERGEALLYLVEAIDKM